MRYAALFPTPLFSWTPPASNRPRLSTPGAHRLLVIRSGCADPWDSFGTVGTKEAKVVSFMLRRSWIPRLSSGRLCPMSQLLGSPSADVLVDCSTSSPMTSDMDSLMAPAWQQ